VVFSFANVAAHSFQFLRDERPFYTPNTVPLTYFAASRQSELPVTVVTRPFQCAGINRHEAEDESSLRERSSDPLGLESCTGYREVLSEA
jgi:hypothetical protein